MSELIRYRVWCLSWEDKEEYGSDVVGYDFLGHDHETQKPGIVYLPSYSLGTAAEAAEAYADFAHRQRDGWDANWPLKFRVRCPDGSLQDFEVVCDYVAEFSAKPAKPAAAESTRT